MRRMKQAREAIPRRWHVVQICLLGFLFFYQNFVTLGELFFFRELFYMTEINWATLRTWLIDLALVAALAAMFLRRGRWLRGRAQAGYLVGVASARALLRLCIPDYLLWMEDLSGFSDFQPFETLLRKESHTWLSDITDDDYASVQADGPAIAVAEAMARRGTDTCYVLDGARLVGVVTLPRFLHNVFRD